MVVVIPEVPGFAGDISDEKSIKTILAAQWRTINRGGHSIYEEITKAGFDPYVSLLDPDHRCDTHRKVGRSTSGSTI